jgi:hypothetical protein
LINTKRQWSIKQLIKILVLRSLSQFIGFNSFIDKWEWSLVTGS